MSDYIVVHGIRIAQSFEPETFGRLTTIGPRFLVSGNTGLAAAKQVCTCTCGTVVVVGTNEMRLHKTKSCGCLSREKARQTCIDANTKHGMSRSGIYKLWHNIRQRCTNPKNLKYPSYGGRGIRVCGRWLDREKGFLNFLEDMGPRPSIDHSVDRYPNRDGNYEPGNCRWATNTEQNRNKITNINLTHGGKTQCLAAWAEELGLNKSVIGARLKAGWTAEQSLTTPRKPHKRR